MQHFEGSFTTASGPDEWKTRYATLSGEIDSIEKQLWQLGSPILFADAMNRFRPVYEAMIEACMTLSRMDELYRGRAFEYAEKMNARTFLDSCRIQGGFGVGVPEEWRVEQGKLLDELKYLGSGDPDKNLDAMQKVHMALGMLEQAVWEKSRHRIVNTKAWPADLASIRNMLPPDTLLVEYVFVQDKLFAFVLNGNELPDLFDLDADRHRVAYLSTLAQLSIQIRQNYSLHRQLEEEMDLHEPWMGNDHLTTLYDLLLRPLAGISSGRQHLILVPCDGLWHVPFHALCRVDGGKRICLIEEHAVTYAPSASALRLLFHRDVIKAPHYVTGVPTLSGGPVLSGDEADMVANLLGTKAANGMKADLLASMDSCGILHISSHSDTRNHVTSQTGLCLTDGVLRPQDIHEARANLVVLSACATCGKDLMPEPQAQFSGMCGRLFRTGARAVIGSMWAVSAKATYILMQEFYTQLTKGTGLARSLQMAQLRVMQEYSGHPFFWAPFILIGADGPGHGS